MKIEPSRVPGVDLIGPHAAEFEDALKLLLGSEPDETLNLAGKFSVIVRNGTRRVIALLGVRFDMVGESGRKYSVVHYADTLRNPEKADLIPGGMRFVCAEPLYTDLVLRQRISRRASDQRARMNLDNLARAREITVSLDCAAFDDGQFAGPDSLGAFERLGSDRKQEIEFLSEFLQPGARIETLLATAMDDGEKARRVLAKHLQQGLLAGGAPEAISRARSYRPRITLFR